MSLLWREQTRIALSPRQVALVRFVRRPRVRVTDRRNVSCREGTGQTNWTGAVEALRELLASPSLGKGEATVVVSSHFVRYLVLPWSAELVTEAEEMEFARTRFLQVFGEVARDWTIVIGSSSAGNSRLCAAIDQALILALTGAVAASSLRLVSVQPALMVQFNEWRGRIGTDGWLVLAEQGRLLVAWVCGGQWRSVRARALNGASIRLAQVLEQEQLMLAAGERKHQVFLAKTGYISIESEGLRVENLVLPAPLAKAAGADAGFALALCGI